MHEFSLPAWPAEAFPLEPAHGFFRRLTQANNQLSCRVMADLVGIKARNIDLEEMLEFCSQFPTQNLVNLATATPKKNGTNLILNGEVFRDHLDYAVGSPRYCASCLRQKNYYRNWFDLRVVRACPLHNELLTTDGYEGRSEWWEPTLGRTDLVARLIDPCRLDWERYLFARMGITSGESHPMLDDQPLRDVIRIAVLLGRALEAATNVATPWSLSNRAEWAARGFDVIKHGRDGLKKVLVGLAEARASTFPESGRLGFEKLFGWISSPLRAQPHYPMADRVKVVLADAAHDLQVFGRKDLNAIAQVPEGYLTLQECSDALGLPIARVRDLATRLGMISGSQPRSHCHGFSAEQADELVATLSRKIGRREAAKYLGLEETEFDRFVRDQNIRPLVRIGGVEKNSDVFDAQTLQDLLASLTVKESTVAGSRRTISFDHYMRVQELSPASLASKLVGGEVQCAGWDHGQVGFRGAVLPEPIYVAVVRKATGRGAPRKLKAHPGMSFAEASAFLGAHPTSIRCLVEQDFLMLEPNESGRDRVTRESVECFGEQYAPARLYAQVLGLTPQRVIADFAFVKVEALPAEKFAGTLWVERASVIEKLGPSWDLRSSDMSNQALWDGLADHWSKTGSANKLVGACGPNATIKSGKGDVLARLENLSDNGGVKMLVRADTTTPKRLRRLRDNLDAVRACWPGMSVVMDEPFEIELSEKFVIGQGGEHLKFAVQAISNIATTLRQTISAAA